MPNAEITVRIDAQAAHRLSDTVAVMQTADPTLTADDCLEAIFTLGLISVSGAYTMVNMIPAFAEAA